jgi:hypothetical protein
MVLKCGSMKPFIKSDIKKILALEIFELPYEFQIDSIA